MNWTLKYAISVAVLGSCGACSVFQALPSSDESLNGGVEEAVAQGEVMAKSLMPAHLQVRDIIPGWIPVVPLDEDDVLPVDGKYALVRTGIPISAPELFVPRFPVHKMRKWTVSRLPKYGVPRGYWWMPKDPSLRGTWLIVASKGAVYILVTRPLGDVDSGLASRNIVVAAQLLADVLGVKVPEKGRIKPVVRP